ncbi:CU044_2847 family protein [Streptomyces sp. NPDC006551]|uniref:CU044_2847 family protein n=1 Tax=Streptomyces sp. NPDC006551 TaxID=3157178 RepID=UPI0033AA5D1A
MPDVTKVDVADGTLYVETERVGPDGDLEGLADHVTDLSGVTRALSSFAGQLSDAVRAAAPDRATVEFGCQLGVEPGGLTAIIVKGSTSANMRVTLEWSKSPH